MCWLLDGDNMDISTLSNFYNGCLRKTLIFWRAKVSNKSLHKITKQQMLGQYLKNIYMEIDRSCIKKGNKRHHKNGAKMDTRRKMRGQQRTKWRRTVKKRSWHKLYVGRNGKYIQEQRRMETPCPYFICLREQQRQGR